MNKGEHENTKLAMAGVEVEVKKAGFGEKDRGCLSPCPHVNGRAR